jgi:hypothetical protein
MWGWDGSTQILDKFVVGVRFPTAPPTQFQKPRLVSGVFEVFNKEIKVGLI